MKNSRAFPPQPSVEHLPTIFRRIENGKIVVPAFQRTFVWEQDDVLALLASVYNGYPIGSVLLWLVDKEFLQITHDQEVPFPRRQPEFPVSYILDGLQRLSSLYGVFTNSDDRKGKIFDVFFDLKAEAFLPGSDVSGNALAVPMNALFNPRRLLDVQRRIIDHQNGDELLTKLTDLQARFQEYMIPLVTLTDRDLDEVVIIFERVNSTGTNLSRVDFMRAITWSDQFDLNDALDKIRESLSGEAFELADDTFVKAMGLVFDLDPLPQVLLALRKQSASLLDKAVNDTIEVFRRVFRFLRDNLSIYSREFVPYEGQLLVLFRVFRDRVVLTDRQATAISAWYLYVSFEEVLKGRPDNFVARMIRSVETQIEEGHIDLPVGPIDPERFIRRRMLKGKALTTAFITMMASLRTSGIISGDQVKPSELTGSYSVNNFVPILTLEEILKVRPHIQSARTPANVLITSPIDAVVKTENARRLIIERAQTPEGALALRRQFIGRGQVHALSEGNNAQFLLDRATLMARAATIMIGAVSVVSEAELFDGAI